MIQLLTNFAAECKDTHSFFGLKPWYEYINDPKHFDICDLTQFQVLPHGSDKSDIPLVLLAIADDLLRIAGIVAIAFIIVGAIQFIMSQGQPEDTAKAQSTIINALLGLAVAVVSVALVSFLGARLGG